MYIYYLFFLDFADENLAVRMQAFKTVETQVPFLKESFFTTTFKGRRKSSVTNILRKQQQSLLNQHQQQQLQQESISEHPGHLAPPSVENGPGQRTLQHQRRIRSTSIPLCKTAERAGADGERKEGPAGRKDHRATEAAHWRLGGQEASGCESVAVSASPCPCSAAQEPGAATAKAAAAAASLPHLQALNSAGKKQAAGGWKQASPSQEAAQHAQSRPQQHGLLAKGVRLLRNMGNQEAKQKKGGGGAAGDVSCEGDASEREVDKKSKKSQSRNSKGEHGTKKKSKSESKGSVFSGMKIRKSLSRARGLSKEDILEDGKSRMRSATDGGLSADEMLSDGEGDPCRLTEDQSAARDLDRKLSSGSDGDLYSFHSAAAESEDLLSDIQQAMKEQRVPGSFSRESPAEEHKTPQMLISSEKKRVAPPPPPPPAEIKHLQREAAVETKQFEKQSRGLDSGGSSAAGSPSESAPDTDRSTVSLLPKTNSTYSFPDTNTTTNTSYESAEEPQDEPESPVLHPLQSHVPCVPLVLLEPAVMPPSPPMGPHKSVSSMDLSTPEQEEEAATRRDFLSLKRRKSSMSIGFLTADAQGPPYRRTSSSSASTVKLYPPIHPSYVKTTTRQLTSPLSSPITSPHVPRKTNTDAAPADATGGAPFRKPKKRSCSIGGSISLSADWPAEQESPDKSSSSGGTYWTLGSRRVHQQRQSSLDTSAFLDVFSGESAEEKKRFQP